MDPLRPHLLPNTNLAHLKFDRVYARVGITGEGQAVLGVDLLQLTRCQALGFGRCHDSRKNVFNYVVCRYKTVASVKMMRQAANSETNGQMMRHAGK